MKATPNQQPPRGSFNFPNNQPKNEQLAQSQAAPEAAEAPAAPEAQNIQDMAEQTRQEQLSEHRKQLEAIEKHLGFTIEQDDVIALVRKGRLAKTVTVIPGVLSVRFQTITGEESQEIQTKIHEFQQATKTTNIGVGNDASFWNLAYGLAEYNGKDMTAVPDKSKVKTLLEKISAHVADKMNAAYVDFNFVVRSKMNDPDFLKSLKVSRGSIQGFLLANNIAPKDALEEALVSRYYDNQRLVTMTQSNLVVAAIMTGVRQISAALVGDTTSNSQSLQKELQSLKGVLFPEFAEESAQAAERAKVIMEKMDKLGPIQIAAIGGSKSGGRVKRGNR